MSERERVHACPTCTCTARRRFRVTPSLLLRVRLLYDSGLTVDEVAAALDRSRSQTYRLLAQARERLP